MLLKLAVDDANLPENIKLEEAVSRALEILRNRIDALGVAEPLIQREGDKYIVIQLPGIKDTNRALDIIGKTALLEFKLVSERYKITEMTDADGNVDPSKVPAEVMVLEGKEGERYVIEKKDLITGADLVDAKVQMGQYGEPVVGFKLSPAGGRKFAEITGDNVNRNLAIVLDDKVYSAPVIKSRISGGEGVIEGNFTIDTSKDLALILRAGALPAPVKIVNKQIIGPSMGADAVKKGMTSMFIGAILVILFMAIYYGVSGIIADFALALNVIFIFGVLAALDAPYASGYCGYHAYACMAVTPTF